MIESEPIERVGERMEDGGSWDGLTVENLSLDRNYLPQFGKGPAGRGH